MLHSVTPWTATVQSDIDGSEPLFETHWKEYRFCICTTGDSVWLTAKWPAGGRIAFRLAFGMNSVFESVSVNRIATGALITAVTRLGSYRINLAFPNSKDAVFRYTVTLQVVQPLLIPFWPRDIVPLTAHGQVENTSGEVHMSQEGARSGMMFFSFTKPETGAVFYFQNLTAVSPYCDVTKTTVANSVGGQWPEIGFQFPVNTEAPLPESREFIISDALVLLSAIIPERDHDKATQFLDYLSQVYQLIPKPEVEVHNWLEIADKVTADLRLNKGCWTQTNGNLFLNAYVADYKTPSELMVQLAVKLPLVEYMKWSGKGQELYDDLNGGLSDFYDDTLKTMVRWHPALEKELDNSEEQKQEMVMDSWYLHHPLANLGRLALSGIKSDEKLFLASVDFAIKVAKHFDYEWPVFYKMTTLEVIKSETSPGNGGEKDVPGSYAHVMLLAFQLTKQKRYLTEALRAVKHLNGLVFDIFYQANNTAFAAAALVELFNETKDQRYMELSYCCLAGIFRNVRLWHGNYGYGKNFPGFFAVFPLNDAPYTAAYEEFEVYAALNHYLTMSRGIELPESLKILLPEFVRYALGRLAYNYPAMLPDEMLSETVKTGEIQKDLWIPLEDIYEGWNKSGQVGQEVYGAGIPFGIVARQYIQIPENDILLFVDGAMANLRIAKRNCTFRTIGHKDLVVHVHVLKHSGKRIQVAQKSGSVYKTVEPKNNSYPVGCGRLIKITW